MKVIRLVLLSLLLAACTPGAEDVNLAQFCAATASSSYDHNLTAQLLTDGIVDEGIPAFLVVESSEEGLIGRVERENCLDGDTNSRNIITGTSGWIAFRPYGYSIEADAAEVLYQEALAGGRGGPQSTVSLPVETDSTGALLVSLAFPHEGRWRVKEVAFFHKGEPVTGILPSEHFSSAWMSAGGADQWVTVDLGRVRRISDVVAHWIFAPDSYSVEVSRDGAKWKPFRPGKWRYVKVLMHSASGERICMSELEVMGPSSSACEPDGWRVCRASEVQSDGAEIASASFDASAWLPASVPGTVLASFIRAGAVPDPDYGDNWEQISESYFNSDFWYRKDLGHIAAGPLRRTVLELDGINWKADVWLNGHLLGDIQGAFIRKSFDITPYLADNGNILAVKIHRNDNPGTVKEKTARWTGYNGGILGADSPTFICSIGWDWLTTVRGRNIGIWDAVRIKEKGPVTVSDPLVVSKISPEGLASITASVFVDGDPSAAEVEGWIGEIHFSKAVASGGEVVFSPEEFPQLKDCDISLWWPNGYGSPTLHDAGFVVRKSGEISDSLHFKAGIREITGDITGDALRLYVNGRRLVPMGGNWGFPQQNLMYSAQQYNIAIDYHRQMHFNMIRNWVGQVADEAFYEACDRHGILVWQEFPLANPADGPDPADEEMFLANAADRVRRLRRHPSIAIWCGRNEGFPPPSLDGPLRESVSTLHPGIPYLSSSADGIVSGHGPYNAMPAEYYFAHQSGKFHTERGMPAVPTWESLCRMMPPEDRWPIGQMWGKHDFTEVGAQKTTTYTALVEEAFGKSTSAREFTALSQWINYDGNRAMFESANSAGRMGLFLWMSHAAWPSLVFCTYDYYFEPTGAFFGCKKACEPLHIQYNSLTENVEVVNTSCPLQEGLTAELSLYNWKGERLSQQSDILDIPEDSTLVCFKADLPCGVSTYLMKLRLLDSEGAAVSENFYMLGNLKVLRTLPPARISRKLSKMPDGSVSVFLRNEDSVPALLVRLILKDRKGNEILPVNYSDNYFALLPGEEKTVVISGGDKNSKLELQQFGDNRRSAAELITEDVATFAAGQCLMLGSSLEEGQMPQSFEDGQLVTSDLTRWTSGFFPGTCWYEYMLNGNKEVFNLAEKLTEEMLDVDSYFKDHDIGFQIMCSAGLAYKITGDEKYLPAIRRAAELLAGRFCPASGTLMSWDSSRPVCKVIIDNMMNLELLTFASKQFGVPEWKEIAISHADNTMANHFRADGSSFHLLEYDIHTGEVLVKKTVQGYADDSAWSRGQSWGLYGYTMMYRETGEKRFLKHAEKIARYLLPLLAVQPVPAWDFCAPEPFQADASAGAVMASALVELASLTRDKTLSSDCLTQAEATLCALASPDYLAASGEIGGFLLKHSTGFFKKGSEVDVPLTYADYYFLEALERLKH